MGEVTTHCAHPGHSVAPRSPSRVSSQIRFNSSYILFNSSYIRFNSSYIRFNSLYIKKGAETISITSRDGIIHHVMRWRDSFATIFFRPSTIFFVLRNSPCHPISSMSQRSHNFLLPPCALYYQCFLSTAIIHNSSNLETRKQFSSNSAEQRALEKTAA